MIEAQGIILDRGPARILDGYDLRVETGSLLAILGANGVGKTTLLNILTGLLQPRSGQLRVEGSIGYVPQLFQAAFSYSVMDMVLMGRARHLGLFGSPGTRDYDIARSFLKLMGISDLEERGFNTLSGGQRQMVMIAQALTSECSILILDEPCSALDYKNQAKVITTLRRLNRDYGQTIIYTTHAPQHALEAATDVLLMKDARTYRHGPVAEVLTPENLSDLYEVAIDRADVAASPRHTFAPRFVLEDTE